MSDTYHVTLVLVLIVDISSTLIQADDVQCMLFNNDVTVMALSSSPESMIYIFNIFKATCLIIKLMLEF